MATSIQSEEPGGAGGGILTPPAPPEPPGPGSPQRADGLALLGSPGVSGHRERPGLVRREDGQVLQLTPLLYGILEAVDGRSTSAEVAEIVSAKVDRHLRPADLEHLIEHKLAPLGLAASSTPLPTSAPRARPLLAVHGRVRVTDPERTRRLATPFTWLYQPLVLVLMTCAAALCIGWVLFDRGLAGPAREALYEPQLLLVVLLLTIASTAFHELGHASACIYGGARPGSMGAGLYLFWPAFYTDVTDAYRLERAGRLRVDLGGIYFNGVFAVLATGAWWLTGWDALLLVVPIQLLQSLRQLPPLIRLDGYHILADLVGVPDLYSHIKPVLLGLLPNRWGRPASRVLRPWARAVVSVWVVLVVPVLAVTLGLMAFALPRLIATAWDSLGLQMAALRQAWAAGDLAAVLLDVVAVLTVALPAVAVPYVLVRMARRTVQRLWTATEGRPGGRLLVSAAVACTIGILGLAWWPDGQYRPIDRDERGSLEDGLDLDLGALGPPLLVASEAEPPPAPPTTEPAPSPTETAERLRVLRTELEAVIRAMPPPQDPAPEWRPPWHVQFNPPVPGDGDNFAIALNLSDDTAALAVAFSLEYADGSTVVDESNRAYALASCLRCVAAAIAFQVVLIVGDADTIIPDNLAVALTGSCVDCVTFALAIQLVVSLSQPLSEGAVEALELLWVQVDALESALGTTVPVEEAAARLVAIEAQILDLLVEDGAIVLSTGTSTDSETPTDTPTSTTTTTAELPATAPSVDDTTTTTEPVPTEEPSTTTTSEPTTTTTIESTPDTTIPEGS